VGGGGGGGSGGGRGGPAVGAARAVYRGRPEEDLPEHWDGQWVPGPEGYKGGETGTIAALDSQPRPVLTERLDTGNQAGGAPQGPPGPSECGVTGLQEGLPRGSLLSGGAEEGGEWPLRGAGGAAPGRMWR